MEENSTLEEKIQYFYDNYEFFMQNAREKTKRDSYGRIILEDCTRDDSIE